jgi:hypothetical protein
MTAIRVDQLEAPMHVPWDDKKSGGEERQIRAAETQYSVMHRMLNVLVVLATIGAALTVFDQVRAFGVAKPLPTAAIFPEARLGFVRLRC